MTQEETMVVTLEGALGLRDAETLAVRLKEALAAGGAVEVDVAAISEIDVAGIQLLAAAQKSAAAAGRRFVISSPPGGRFARPWCGSEFFPPKSNAARRPTPSGWASLPQEVPQHEQDHSHHR